MRTLEELRKVFVEARKLALEGDPSKIDLVVKNLNILSSHCKELIDFETEFTEKAKAKRLYDNIEKVKGAIMKQGYNSSIVIKFFGLPPKKVEAPKAPIEFPVSDDLFASEENNSGGDLSSMLSDSQAESEEPQPIELVEPEFEQPIEPLFEQPISEEPIEPIEFVEPIEPIEPMFEQPVENDDAFVDLDADDYAAEFPYGDTSDFDSIETIEPDDFQTGSDLPMIQDVPEFETPIDEELNDSVDEERKAKEFVPTENALEPNSFADFIGQTHIVKRLSEEVAVARISGVKHIDNILLLGNKGLGKSALMKIIAKELGVKYEYIDCTSFAAGGKGEIKNFHEFMLRIINENEPVVLGFDEIHALPDKIQDRLLVLLQDQKYSYLEKGVAHNFPMPEFTFIGATTDYDVLREPLKDRCSNLTFTMEDYTRDELSQILCNKFAAMGFEARGEVLECCVNRFRSSLRDIKAIVMGIRTKAILADTNVVTVEMAESYFKDRGLDAIGLNKKELEILNAIKNDPKGVVSEDTLAGRVYLDVKIFKSVYEPYLNKIGFIATTSRGRELTQRALDYLNYGYFDFGNGYYIGTNPRDDEEQE